MCVQRPSEEKVWYCDAVRHLLPVRGQRGERRRHDRAANVAVGHASENRVEDCGESLQGVRGSHGMLGFLHLRNEDEKPATISDATTGQ